MPKITAVPGMTGNDALILGQRLHNMGQIQNVEDKDYYLKPTPLYSENTSFREYLFFAQVGKYSEVDTVKIFETCVSKTLDWLIGRFGESPYPIELKEQSESKIFKTVHLPGGCNIYIAYAECGTEAQKQRKTDTICLK